MPRSYLGDGSVNFYTMPSGDAPWNDRVLLLYELWRCERKFRLIPYPKIRCINFHQTTNSVFIEIWEEHGNYQYFYDHDSEDELEQYAEDKEWLIKNVLTVNEK